MEGRKGRGEIHGRIVERGVVRSRPLRRSRQGNTLSSEIWNIAWRLDGVSPYQSKLASREWCHGQLRRRHINFHGSTGYGQKFTDSISGIGAGNRMSI